MNITADESRASVRFTAEMQEQFAELSGDFNPMHIDEVAARRFLYGTTVAHGVQVVLQGLEAILRDSSDAPRSLTCLKAQFNAPVMTGETVDYRISQESDGTTRVIATSAGVTAMDLSCRLVERALPDTNWPEGADDRLREPPESLVLEDFEKPITGSVSTVFPDRLLHSLLPCVSATLPRHQVAALLASTRIVGMKCPGYHSIFSDLSLNFAEATDDDFCASYQVADFDPRFRLASLNLSSATFSGQIRAFLRPPPVTQSPYSTVSEHIAPTDFSGVRALVVGGSRGLGELTTKILAAGGADVIFTYKTGKGDANAILLELGGDSDRHRSIELDVLHPNRDSVQDLREWKPTHLFYFATARIAKGRASAFSHDRYRLMTELYVSGFANLFFSLIDAQSLRFVLNPSTTYVDECPAGMAEYLSAKASAEALCEYLSRRYPAVTFATPRLPRLPTDQTADIASGTRRDALPLLVEMLRDTTRSKSL